MNTINYKNHVEIIYFTFHVWENHQIYFMKKLKNTLMLITIFVISLEFTIGISISIFAQIQGDTDLSQEILSKNEENEISNLSKYAENIFFGKRLNEVTSTLNAKAGFNDLKPLHPKLILSIQDNSLDQSSYSTDQIKIIKKLNRIIYQNIIEKNGTEKHVYNLSENQFDILINNLQNNKKILKLIDKLEKVENNNLFSVKTNAFGYENCQVETGFNSKVNYQLKTYYGRKADWVGRIANDYNELNFQPCDYQFYINGYEMKKVDGWTIAAECAIINKGFMSRKTYGSNTNNKAIFGYFTLLSCGNYMNTDHFRNAFQFYNN
jgi:hypothetical protein